MDIDSGEVQVKNPDSPNPLFRSKGSNAWMNDSDKADDLRKVQMLKRISKILNCHKVAQLIVLSCAAGNDPTLGPALSKVLNTRVGLYKQLVAIGDIIYTSPGQRQRTVKQIWLAPITCKTAKDADKYRPALTYGPDHAPNNHASLHEYPEPEVFSPSF
jgi:hypothetical protein